MPTQNVNLTQKHHDFVRESVASGDYNSASEVVRDALRVLEVKKDEDAAHLDWLRGEIQKGLDDVKAGRTIDISTREARDAYFEDVLRRVEDRPPKEANATSNRT